MKKGCSGSFKARQDLDDANYTLKGKMYHLACFLFQQAGEKALKAYRISPERKAEIGYVRRDPNSKRNAMKISEIYHGNFTTEQSLDSYSSNASYTKYANGTGEISSDKRVGCNQRSDEHGTGSYESEEKLSTGNDHKISNITCKPINQSAGNFRINYKGKWSDFMYTEILLRTRRF